MRKSAGEAERLLERLTDLLAQARAFGLSLDAERVELCVQLRKHKHEIPQYEKWCGSDRTPPKA